MVEPGGRCRVTVGHSTVSRPAPSAAPPLVLGRQAVQPSTSVAPDATTIPCESLLRSLDSYLPPIPSPRAISVAQ